MGERGRDVGMKRRRKGGRHDICLVTDRITNLPPANEEMKPYK